MHILYYIIFSFPCLDPAAIERGKNARCCFQTLWLIDGGLAHRLSLAEGVRWRLSRRVAKGISKGA